MSALVPRWAEVGGRDSPVARIKSPSTHRAVKPPKCATIFGGGRRGGDAHHERLRQRDLEGRRLDENAAARGVEPVEAAMEIIRTVGDQSVASFNMDAKDMDTFMRADFVTTCSDGSDGHPRKYGTFPKKIRDYVIDRHVITMERAIAAGSGQPARDMHIAERGVVKVNWFADVIVFDPATIRDLSTYAEPEKLATGMRYVVVNGKLAVDNGKPTNVLAGRALRLAK